MADETQYFDFSGAQDPFKGVSPKALASLLPKGESQLRIDLLKESNTIGRTNETDVTISHRNVSKRHAKLTKDGSMWELEDIGSTNGTYVNGSKVTSPVLISPGDTVAFGDQVYQFVVHGEETKQPADAKETADGEPAAAAGGGMTAMFGNLFQPGQQEGGGQPGAGAPPRQPSAPQQAPPRPASQPSAATAAPPRPQPSQPSAPAPEDVGEAKTVMRSYDFAQADQSKSYATLIEKSLTSKQYALKSIRNRIGSAVTNEVQIQDSSLRPEHAEISFERDGRTRIRVLESDLTVKLNGEPVKTQHLKDLDNIQIGDIVFTFKLNEFPSEEEFEAVAGRKEGSGAKIAALALVILAAIAGAGVFLGPQFFGGGASEGGGEAVATPTPPPIANPQKSDFELAKSLFEKRKLVEARDVAEKLDLSDPDARALEEAIRISIEASSSLDSGNIVAASRAMARIEGNPYSNAEAIVRLREELEFQQMTKAREAYDRAQREFASERYADAQEYFERADQILPGFEDAESRGTVARLAKEGRQAVREGEEALVAGEFRKAEDILNNMLDALKRREDLLAQSDVLQRLRTDISDRFYFGLMQRHYREGNGQEALNAYEQITADFRARQRLDVLAEKIRKIIPLAEQAVAEESLPKALAILELEQTRGNYYYELAARLKSELSERQRARAQEAFNIGKQYSDSAPDISIAREPYLNALVQYWKARQLDPTWEAPRRAHETTATQLNAYAYSRGDIPENRAEKIEIYRFVMENSDPEDTVYKQAKRQLDSLAP